MDELQQKYMEYKHIQEQLQEMQKHLEALGEKEGHADATIDAVEQMKDVKEGTSLLVPIANGIFFQAKLEDASKFHINVGAGVTVVKSADDAKNLLSDQKKGMREIAENLTQQMAKVISRSQELEQELSNV